MAAAAAAPPPRKTKSRPRRTAKLPAAPDPPVKLSPEWPADRVARRPISAMMANPRNARVHSDQQVDEIAALIREFGWTYPVILDDKGVILAGHGRVLAAMRLGLETVPAIVMDGLSEARKRALMLADNKVPSNAEWDNLLLRDELLFLQAEGVDLALVGFDDDDLVAFLQTGTGQATDPGAVSLPGDEDSEHVCPKCGHVFTDGD